jgi:hypothetical protein
MISEVGTAGTLPRRDFCNIQIAALNGSGQLARKTIGIFLSLLGQINSKIQLKIGICSKKSNMGAVAFWALPP